MAVRVRLFAALRELAGSEIVEVAAGSLPEIIDGLRGAYGPRFSAVLDCCAVVVDGETSDAESPERLPDGTEVALLPPVSGGAVSLAGRSRTAPLSTARSYTRAP